MGGRGGKSGGGGGAGGAAGGGVSLADQIIAAWQAFSSGQPDKYMTLEQLANALGGGISKSQLDATLTALYKSQRINLISRGYRSMTEAQERAYGLALGGETKWLMSAYQNVYD